MSDAAPQGPHQASTPDARTTIVDAPAQAFREATLRHELARTKKRLHGAAAGTILAVLVIACLAARMIVIEQRHHLPPHAANEAAVDQRDAVRGDDLPYVQSMASATEDMIQGREAAVREVLERQRPAPGTRDRRGWEWYYADTLLNPGTSEVMVSERPLKAMAVSPDEHTVAVAGDDGRITLWSADSLASITGWEAKGGAVRGLTWSASGLLAAALDDGGVAVWETGASPHETARWKAHDKTTTAVQWHPRDPLLISAGADGGVSVWKPSGELVKSSQCGGPVLAIDMQRDSKVMAALLGKPNRLLVAEPEQMDGAHELPLGMDGTALAWQPAGGWMVLSRHGYPVNLFNPHLKGDKGIDCLTSEVIPRATAFAWLPKGKVMVVGSINGSILLNNPRDPNDKPTKLNGHKGRVSAVASLTHRDRLLSIGEDGILRAWDEARRPVQTSEINTVCPISAAQWNPAQELLAIVLSDDEVQVRSGTTNEVLWTHALPRPVDLNTPHHKATLAWSPDGKLLAVGCAGRALTLWNADGSRAGSLGTMMAEEVSWMPDGRRMLVKTSGEWRTLATDGSTENISAAPGTDWLISFSGGRLASLFADGDEVRWQFLGGAPSPKTALPLKLSSHIICVASNPAHTRMALGAENGTVAWFDVQTSQWSRPSLAHSGPVAALAWSADGSRLASFGADGKCRIFHVAEATQTWMLSYRTNPELVGAGWNARGDKLMVACQSENRIRTFDAGRSMDREQGSKPNDDKQKHRLADACDAIERHPGCDAGWSSLKRLLAPLPQGATKAELDLLMAAADMGELARFHSKFKAAEGAKAVTAWHQHPLPTSLQVLECCALGQWEEVIRLCQKAEGQPERKAWYRLAQAEALQHLGRENEAGKLWLQSWQTQRSAWVSDAEQDEPAGRDPATASHPSLAPWACIPLDSDWTGGDQNNLSSLPPVLKQPGFEFATGSFIQMAGKSLRATSQHMFPRITDWMPLGKPAHKMAFLISVSCYTAPGAVAEPIRSGTCVGNIFLRRDNGTAARIPLIYGSNIWDWWVPLQGGLTPPKELVAWTGSNPRASSMGHSLALYRLEWDAGATGPAATDFSISSTIRRAAPMLLAVEVVR